MPQLGETVAEGKITKWFKSAGDAVKPGDNLFEIETDKTSMEVPATSAGTLTAINFKVGEVAKVGAVVAVLMGAGETPQARRCKAPPRRAKRRSAAGTSRRLAAAPAHSLQIVRSDGPVERSPHAGEKLRPGTVAGRRACHATGAAARGRARYRSFGAHRLGSARPHRSQRCRDSAAPSRGALASGRQRRAGQGAV